MLRNPIDRIRLLVCKDKESYRCFYRILGFYPKNIQLYKQALLHKSTSIRSDKGQLINNERLEFLGDAILDAIVGHIVYQQFEGKGEGFLTNTRSKIVQRETLNKLAIEIGLSKLIKYSSRSSSHNSYMYGNAFEALIGAIYLDQGYKRCKQFIEQRIFKQYIDLEKISRKEVNFKSKLIEWSQKHKLEVSFELIEQFIDHEGSPMFQTEIRIEGIAAGTGTGYSKKETQPSGESSPASLSHASRKPKTNTVKPSRPKRKRLSLATPSRKATRPTKRHRHANPQILQTASRRLRTHPLPLSQMPTDAHASLQSSRAVLPKQQLSKSSIQH